MTHVWGMGPPARCGRWPLAMSLVLGAVGCLPADPDFGECNRDEDCVLGRCVEMRCLVAVGPDGGADVPDAAPADLGPQLACDAPVIPLREQRSPCGQACEIEGFVEIEPGRFMMGPGPDEADLPSGPFAATPHEVTLTRGFWMKAHEVTIGEWRALSTLLPSWAAAESAPGCDDADCPVVMVDGYEAMAWCNARSILEGLPPCYRLEDCAPGPDNTLVCARVTVEAPDQNPLDCVGYRLPTEAEWEYAVRAGTDTAYYSGPAQGGPEADPAVDPIAWYRPNADDRAHGVGQKVPNAWGLYDMAGNVWEQVWDGAGAYRPAPATDPLGATGDDRMIIRGGAFGRSAVDVRSAFRQAYSRSRGALDIGFRPARTRIVCGDGVCSASESSASCPGDCPLSGYAIVPAGLDVLGSPDDEVGREDPGSGAAWSEARRSVRLERSVWLKQTEVTQAEWAALAPSMDGDAAPAAVADCARCPVEQISWYAALAWCNAASRAEGLAECYRLEGCEGAPGADFDCVDVTVEAPDGDPQACEGYRLPTASEWEYAARAGADTAWHHAPIDAADVDAELDAIGWYAANADGAPQPVGQKGGSCWGLYDVAGNVHEWVWDAPGEYVAGRVTDPILPPDPNVSERIVRGGAFDSTAARTRAAARAERLADARDPTVGFRPARTILRPVTMPAWPLASRGPSGGLIFYDKGVYTNGWRYMEAAAGDLTGPWGCGMPRAGERGEFVPDLVPSWIGSGRVNTPLIVAGCDQPGIAAELADRVDVGGVDDWFLPSVPTFAAIYAALMQHGLGDFSTRGDAFYWTSSQVDRDFATAWQVVEERGVAWNKNIASWVRPVRAF